MYTGTIKVPIITNDWVIESRNIQEQVKNNKFLKNNIFEWSIFLIFWKPHCCPDFLFLKLGISDLHHRPGVEQGF